MSSIDLEIKCLYIISREMLNQFFELVLFWHAVGFPNLLHRPWPFVFITYQQGNEKTIVTIFIVFLLVCLFLAIQSGVDSQWVLSIIFSALSCFSIGVGPFVEEGHRMDGGKNKVCLQKEPTKRVLSFAAGDWNWGKSWQCSACCRFRFASSIPSVLFVCLFVSVFLS